MEKAGTESDLQLRGTSLTSSCTEIIIHNLTSATDDEIQAAPISTHTRALWMDYGIVLES